jgi:hypothetical protein
MTGTEVQRHGDLQMGSSHTSLIVSAGVVFSFMFTRTPTLSSCVKY